MFKQLKIGSRLAFSFGAMMLLICAVAGFGTYQAARMNDEVLEQTVDWLPSVKTLGELRSLANMLRRSSLRHVLETGPEGKDRQLAIHEDVRLKKWPSALSDYEKMVSSPEEARLFEEMKTLWAAYLVDDRTLIALSTGGAASFEAARQMSVGASGTSFAKILKVIEENVDLNAAGSKASADAAAATYGSVLWLNAAAVVASLLVGIALSVTITRSITQPLGRAVQVAENVAEGDLRSRVDEQGVDEVAQLLRALGRMNDNLLRVVGQVRNSSDSIATGSAQIATGNADLSQRTEEQASNLQQTAASMEEIAGTVRNSADTARQATQMAASASTAAQRGGVVVGEVVATMDDITASSRKISEIIGVIDGIAFQTNILALNAAVEAARAGEQGRGFAVVASEVRSLAQRSAEAAKEIKGLIGASVQKVEAGSRLVVDAGATMTDIVAQVKQVADLIDEISVATQEQTTGIQQIGEAVTQLDQVTQQNAALVEESAAAAESLKHQAAQLVEAVGAFKLG